MKQHETASLLSWMASFPSRRWDERRSLWFYMFAYNFVLILEGIRLLVSSHTLLGFVLLGVVGFTAFLVPGKNTHHDEQANQSGEYSISVKED